MENEITSSYKGEEPSRELLTAAWIELITAVLKRGEVPGVEK